MRAMVRKVYFVGVSRHHQRGGTIILLLQSLEVIGAEVPDSVLVP